MALVRAWPRWRVPVTFGGGRVIMNDPLVLGSLTLFLCKREREREKSEGGEG